MPTWTNLEDRRLASLAFAALLDSDPAARQACKDDPVVARKTFAEAGQMDDIPESVVFRVFEENDRSRDDLVVIVLPQRGTPTDFLPSYDILRCTIHPPPGGKSA